MAALPEAGDEKRQVNEEDGEHGFVLVELQTHEGIDAPVHHDGAQSENQDETTSADRDNNEGVDEMDADHVTAWSKGGDSSAKNCQMLCITHNRAKGNR